MLTLTLLSLLLHSPTTYALESRAMTALYAAQGSRAERMHRNAEVARFADEMDQVLATATGRKLSPFESDGFDPFEVDGQEVRR